MRKNTIIIAGVFVIITATIVGTGYYLNKVQTAQAPAAAAETTWTTLQAHANQPTGKAKTVPDVSAGTSFGRTDTPIKCFDPAVGEFWTNAARCEDADLDNRLSYAAPLATTPYKDRYSGQAYTPPATAAANARSDQKPQKPNLRLYAKAPPDNLNVSCKFSVGKALEIERALSAARDPRTSIWRKDYCRWRARAREEGCMVSRDLFYYADLCAAYYQ